MFTFKYNKSHNKSKQGDQKMANERYALNKQLAQMFVKNAKQEKEVVWLVKNNWLKT